MKEVQVDAEGAQDHASACPCPALPSRVESRAIAHHARVLEHGDDASFPGL